MYHRMCLDAGRGGGSFSAKTAVVKPSYYVCASVGRSVPPTHTHARTHPARRVFYGGLRTQQRDHLFLVMAAPERHGHCSTSGWVSTSTTPSTPNCTWVGKRSYRGSMMVGSCARNVRAALEQHSRAWVTAFLDTQPGSAALIFEDQQRSGDPDGTRAALRNWANSDPRVRLLLAQPLLYPKWSRTQRLALCRNMLAHEATRLPGSSGVLVALDLDCRPPTAAQTAAFLATALLGTQRWDAITSNTPLPAFYYDRWALRSHTLTLDYDCWFNRTLRAARGACPDYAITIDPNAAPFAVDSAFNGLGLYRASSIRAALDAGCTYRGTKNSYLCEHVPFHLCMRSKGMTIGVLPALNVECGRTEVSPPSRRRRIQLLANGSVLVSPPRLLPPGSNAWGGGSNRGEARAARRRAG